jgi:hypothetical protein
MKYANTNIVPDKCTRFLQGTTDDHVISGRVTTIGVDDFRHINKDTSMNFTSTLYGSPVDTGVYHYAAPFTDPIPSTEVTITTTGTGNEQVNDPEKDDREDEAYAVGETVRLALEGKISDKARELLNVVLDRCSNVTRWPVENESPSKKSIANDMNFTSTLYGSPVDTGVYHYAAPFFAKDKTRRARRRLDKAIVSYEEQQIFLDRMTND